MNTPNHSNPSLRSLGAVRRTLKLALGALALAASLFVGAPGLASAQRATASSSEAAPSGVVNIQTATVEQLRLLPGIGPSKAEAIVAQRERRAFRRVQDILRVRGIGRATFRRLRSMITVDGPTTMSAPQARRSSSD